MTPTSPIENDNMSQLIGQKIIAISNDPPYARVGIITSFQSVSQSENLMPIVEFDGKEYLCFAVIAPYDEVIFETLIKLGRSAVDWFVKFIQVRENIKRLQRREDAT